MTAPAHIAGRAVWKRPAAAVGLLALALGAWGLVLSQQISPERRHLEAGIAYARQKQGARAEQEWWEATRLDSGDPIPWQYLSTYYEAIHNGQAATEALQHLAKLKPNAPRLAARLAASSLQMGDEQAAYHYAEDALKQNPNDVETLKLFCGLLARTGERQKRIELLRRLHQLQPDDVENERLLAAALADDALYAEAKPLVEQILQKDPNDLEAASLHGMILFNTDPSPQGTVRAEADFLRALPNPKFAPFAHFYLGRIYKRQGKPQKAVTQLEAAARSLGSKQEVFFELADAYTQAGQLQKADRARRQFEALKAKASASQKRLQTGGP